MSTRLRRILSGSSNPVFDEAIASAASAVSSVEEARDASLAVVEDAADAARAEIAALAGGLGAAEINEGDIPVVALEDDAGGRYVYQTITATGEVDFPTGLGEAAIASVRATIPELDALATQDSAASGIPVVALEDDAGDTYVYQYLTAAGETEFPAGFGSDTYALLRTWHDAIDHDGLVSGGGGGGGGGGVEGLAGYDLFVCAGQSNATDAYQTAALAPTPTGSFLWNNTAGVFEAMGQTKGLWSAFCDAYQKRTGRGVLFVPVAISATAVNSWTPGNSSHTAAIARIAGALTAATSAYSVSRIAGVLWLQGESDYLTAEADYKTRLEAVIADFRTRYGVGLRWLIALVGKYDQSGAAGTTCAHIRAAQREVVAADPFAHIGAAGIEDFQSRGLLFDGVHYTQAGYTLVGRMLADAAATTPNLNL